MLQSEGQAECLCRASETSRRDRLNTYNKVNRAGQAGVPSAARGFADNRELDSTDTLHTKARKQPSANTDLLLASALHCGTHSPPLKKPDGCVRAHMR